MKLLRVWAIARKEFIHIIRDPRSLAMGIAIPMLLLLLFGYANNHAAFTQPEHLRMALEEMGTKCATRDLLPRFRSDDSPCLFESCSHLSFSSILHSFPFATIHEAPVCC